MSQKDDKMKFPIRPWHVGVGTFLVSMFFIYIDHVNGKDIDLTLDKKSNDEILSQQYNESASQLNEILGSIPYPFSMIVGALFIAVIAVIGYSFLLPKIEE